MFVLADGMGGHPLGEVAAQLALQSFAWLFQKEAKPWIAHPGSFLANAVLTAHREIHHFAKKRGMLECPRTTVVACLIQDGRLFWVHCGDSRMYVVREQQLLFRTRDHSYMEAQNITGLAPKVTNRNVLFSCLGSSVKPIYNTAGPMLLSPRDRILLCSDGLWSSVSDREIVRVLSLSPVDYAGSILVDLALERAGAASDNVTVLALDWENHGAALSDPAELATSLTDTLFLNDNDLASTIEPAPVDMSTQVLDDDDIDRSIAQIKQAIDRRVKR